MINTTRVSATENFIEIQTMFQNKELCKSIAGYRWNPSKKVWYYQKTIETAKKINEIFPNSVSDNSFKELLEKEELEEFEIEDFSEVPNTKMLCWNHQCAAYNFSKNKKSVALFMDMGTGKSKVAIDLLNNLEVKKILIVCPLSVVGVWPREFIKHGTKNYQVLPLNFGSVKQKNEKAQQHMELCRVRNEPGVIVINYESLWRTPFAEFAAKQKFDSVILDESHRIKAPGGKASRYLANLGKSIEHKMILTGTPMPHNPGDLYAQYRFLAPEVFGTSFIRFKNEYAIPLDQYTVSWTKKPAQLSKKMYSIAFRVSKDILDLPEAVHETRECKLSPKNFKTYKELEKEFYVEIEQGIVTVNNALTKLLRLQQIANGFVKNDEGKIVQVDSAKQNLLSDIIEDIPRSEKIIVFSKFIHDLDVVKEVGKSLERRYGEISGRQKDLTEHATMPDDIDLMGVQMQAGGVGIDLSKARYCIYFSVGFSLGDYEQSLARVHRPGQKNKVFYIHMIVNHTVDEKIYKALEQKKDIINTIINKEV